jgi:hypothetical protein
MQDVFRCICTLYLDGLKLALDHGLVAATGKQPDVCYTCTRHDLLDSDKLCSIG